jgi:serine/threonine protein kinase
VHCGYDHATQQLVAIKQLPKSVFVKLGSFSWSTTKQSRHNDTLLREYRMGNRLHFVDGLCRPVAFIERSTFIYLIFPMATCDLFAWLNSFGLASHKREDHFRRLLKTVFDTVAHVHDIGFAHRDIKLENILVFGSDVQSMTLKLTDLEFAARASRFNGKDAVGTFGYCAPEVIMRTEKKEAIDYRLADAWSLGVVLLSCLCNAFDVETMAAEVYCIPTLHRIIHNLSCSDSAKDLLCNLLCERETRLFVSEACAHEFWV